jgi:REP element-mobilizing transposase RayT
MSQGYQIYNQHALYYLTFQIVKWVDVFTRVEYKDIIVNSFYYCRKNKGLELYGYVIMSNHIHVIARSQESHRLSDTIRDFKKFTAYQLLERIRLPNESRSDWMLKRFEFAAKEHARNSEYQIWTHENHAVELFSKEFTQQKLDYIHQNPVRAGIVDGPEDYVYSSARNYAGMKGKIEIDFL